MTCWAGSSTSWNQNFWEKYQNLRWHHPYGTKRRGSKEPLDQSERRVGKAGLKLNIQKTKIMASGPITLWQIDGETMEIVRDFIFLGSKITACSHEIKRHLLLGRKVMTNLDSILKSKHHFADKDAYSQSYLKLKLQYFGHLIWRTDSLEKTLMLGKIEGRRRRGWQRMPMVGWHHWLNGHEFGWTLGVGDGQGGLVCCGSWFCKESDMTEQLNSTMIIYDEISQSNWNRREHSKSDKEHLKNPTINIIFND